MILHRQISPLRQFAEHPPKLEGGVRARLQLVDERHGVLLLEHNGHRLKLHAAALAIPYPSGLERLLALEPEVEAVIVERIPPGLAAAAEARQIACLDGHGRGRAVGPGFVYVAPPRGDRPAPRSSRSSPFAPSASRVVRALLVEPARRWRLSDVAALCELNPGNVHRTLAALQESGFVERNIESYLVVDPGSLLEAWADNAVAAKERRTIHVGEDLRGAVEELLDRLSGRAVVSGELAAELLAPHLPARSAIVHCLDVRDWSRLPIGEWAEPSAGESGQLRVVLDLPDPGVAQFGAPIEGLDAVHPVQVYVDLVRAAGRGRQAADELRRQRLRF